MLLRQKFLPQPPSLRAPDHRIGERDELIGCRHAGSCISGRLARGEQDAQQSRSQSWRRLIRVARICHDLLDPRDSLARPAVEDPDVGIEGGDRAFDLNPCASGAVTFARSTNRRSAGVSFMSRASSDAKSRPTAWL